MMRTILIEGVMPKPILRLVLLMLIMLNHAVSACESIVMHLPAENHPFSVLDSSSHTQHQHCTIEASADESAEDVSEHQAVHNDDPHPTHAHVACYIAELYSVSAAPAVHKASALAQYALITTTYSPPVPPPNA
ncbi:cobalt transporter [Rheinheimera sp.]|uniref:cobalt transporter n=1 Tax=Rheinheimera sp. TaxID=1869214 RepID=UPI0026200FE6|nr:cobalt transporter [Rheinheimera sp.]MCA1929277.1 cobalt transporter [Rheinheimera sp.]